MAVICQMPLILVSKVPSVFQSPVTVREGNVVVANMGQRMMCSKGVPTHLVK